LSETAQALENLWLEIFEGLVRGGMLPDVARDRVVRGSGRRRDFADRVHARWRASLEQLRDEALRVAR
jgi:hypothetical protein